MSGKQERKLRQLVRRNQRKIIENVQPTLVNQSWDCFFHTISEMKLKYRIKLAWKILCGRDIREEEQKKLIKEGC